MISEQKQQIGKLQLNVATAGEDGPPLVMLHGVTRRWQTFLPLISSLTTRWQVHAIDFRGHGISDPVDEAYRVIDYVDDAVAYLQAHLQEPAVVYGHSLGAMVTAAVAARTPELVRAIVMEDPPFETMGSRIEQTPLHSYFAGMAQFAGSSLPVAELARQLGAVTITHPVTEEQWQVRSVRDGTFLRFTARSLTQLHPAVFTPIVESRWLEGYDEDQLLPRVLCPALLLQADYNNGGMLPDDDAEQVTAQIPDCTRVQFPGVGHVIHWNATQRLLQMVLGFLESV